MTLKYAMLLIFRNSEFGDTTKYVKEGTNGLTGKTRLFKLIGDAHYYRQSLEFKELVKTYERVFNTTFQTFELVVRFDYD